MGHTIKSYDAPALIALEGKIAFRFICREQDRAIYLVAGFETGEKSIRVIDYRTVGLSAIDKVIETGNDTLFTGDFCTPARVTICEAETGIDIELFELAATTKPVFMLWIATGIEEPIPDYEYLFLRIEPFDDNSYSLVSIFNYQRFQAYFDGVAVEDLVENRN